MRINSIPFNQEDTDRLDDAERRNDERIAALQNLPAMPPLNLQGVHMNNAGREHLRNQPQLQRLDPRDQNNNDVALHRLRGLDI